MSLPDVRVRIMLRSPLAVSTGRPSIDADHAVARTADTGTPYIPATTLKGAARDALRLLPSSIAAHEALAFGASGTRQGLCWLSDALPDRPDAVVTDLVTTVALSERRTPLPGRLTTSEVVLPRTAQGAPTAFVATVGVAREHQADPRAADALAALLHGLADVRVLGRRTRRGWGRVAVALEPASTRQVLRQVGDQGGGT